MMEEDYSTLLLKKHIREAVLVCKILDAVRKWTNDCWVCMYSHEFLSLLRTMDEKALQHYLDNEDWKTHFKKHKKSMQMHDLNIF